MYYGFFERNLFAITPIENVANVTTLTELIGINIAATKGERLPCTAKYKPIKLYTNEIMKLMITIKNEILVNLIKSGSCLNFDDSIIPSQAGEKL